MTIRGMDSLVRKIDALGGNSKKALKTGILQATKLVQGDAKDLAPADEGQLRNSIQGTVEEKSGAIIGKVSTNVEHAVHVEFGTGQRGENSPSPPKSPENLSYRQDWAGMDAQPYLYPALQQNKAKTKQMVKEHLLKEIRKLGGS
ncbi:HK97 gp10 family phage protein [Metasolibacillus meyeri]|uniref:HK97 gp10 family phage protein n=1 Tax=Metasolibacillus meyeri TaxID=1071052 RepID=A0AAW9NNQ2_9BACL|nr:HK97-gp10 family putative phage morphogenesis protein [Metasolibacillus meyeri]MEC1177620.1 HK97 gp10 family phage protein [Metasolibacillus meyeri]